MLSWIPDWLRGTVASILAIVNLVFWCIPFYLLAIVKLLPIAPLRRACFRGLETLAGLWIDGNGAIARSQGVRYDVRGADDLAYDHWYLIGTNHVSWVDVVALQYAFNHKIPFLRFFLKRQLIWIPLLGLAWWALELPFMRRHSPAQIEANPQLRMADIETTRRACAPFRARPTAIINFLEGTRFTPAKHAAQSSPYRHLLRPKVGGIAYAIDAIGEVMNTYLDVTLVYPPNASTFWDLMCGRVHKVIIHVEKRTVPDELMRGDYGADARYRARFKDWIEDIWQEKDRRIEQLSKEFVSEK
jgi:1-acyl-sn-glycerol-3-phosphate acyltransferase